MKWVVRFPKKRQVFENEHSWARVNDVIGVSILAGVKEERTEFDDLKRARLIAKVVGGKVYRVKSTKRYPRYPFEEAMEGVFSYDQSYRRASWIKGDYISANKLCGIDFNSEGLCDPEYYPTAADKLAEDWEPYDESIS